VEATRSENRVVVQSSATRADLRALEALPKNREKWFELLNGVIYE
jgi:hypothetical protein